MLSGAQSPTYPTVDPGSVDPQGLKPQPKTLTAEEQQAIEDYNAGRPYKEAAYKSGRAKQVTNEKYAKQRNKQKRNNFIAAGLGALAAGGTVYYAAKLAAPLCGPAVLVCAVVL